MKLYHFIIWNLAMEYDCNNYHVFMVADNEEQAKAKLLMLHGYDFHDDYWIDDSDVNHPREYYPDAVEDAPLDESIGILIAN